MRLSDVFEGFGGLGLYALGFRWALVFRRFENFTNFRAVRATGHRMCALEGQELGIPGEGGRGLELPSLGYFIRFGV